MQSIGQQVSYYSFSIFKTIDVPSVLNVMVEIASSSLSDAELEDLATGLHYTLAATDIVACPYRKNDLPIIKDKEVNTICLALFVTKANLAALINHTITFFNTLDRTIEIQQGYHIG